MTSKERVLLTFAHQEPDRVPVNYLANPGIDRRLKKHFGLRDDDEGLLTALDIDFRYISPVYAGPRLHLELPGRNVDPASGIRTRWIEHESGGYWDYCDFPLQNAGLEEIESWPMPSHDDYDYSHIAESCRRYRSYPVCVYAMPDVINTTGMLRTMEQVLVVLITDDEAGLRCIDRRLALQLQVLERTLEAAQGSVDIVWLGEDLGTQNSPLISMDIFKRHIRPRHQPFVDLARAYGAIPMEHTCGSSSWAYEDFIEMGIQAVDTLQPEAANMSPSYLKANFGGRLAFHGCISTAGPLAYGTPEDVSAKVQETLEVMMPSGGYALAPTHAIQDNTPTENVLAMYEAARTYGKYI
ncbi:MAG: uroporphyrinogen decarboxylase family protein [bacterium]|nr:uroporphyrinogen decarboxylase family protein [bacterium]